MLTAIAPSGLGALVALLLLTAPSTIDAIGEFIPGGSRSAGVGDAYVGLVEGGEGVVWNPGSVAIGDPIAIAVGYDRPFGIKALETTSVAAKLRLGRIGFGYQYQGLQTSTLLETTNGVTLGLRVKEVASGVRARQFMLRAGGRTCQSVVFDLGVIVESRAGIRVGMVGLNVTGVNTASLGQGGMVGLAVVRATTIVTVDVPKEAGTSTGGGVGIEHRVHPLARIRAGLSGYPERLTMGLGVNRARVEIDYGILYHTVLGLSHRLSVAYSR